MKDDQDKLARELLRMKKIAEESAQEASELKGRLAQITATLKEDYKCSSIEEAQDLLEELEEQIQTLEEEIKQGLLEVKETYGF